LMRWNKWNKTLCMLLCGKYCIHALDPRSVLLDNILQKRPIILGMLLCECAHTAFCAHLQVYMRAWIIGNMIYYTQVMTHTHIYYIHACSVHACYYAHTYKHTCCYAHTYTHTHMHTWMHEWIYIYICLCIYINIYIYI